MLLFILYINIAFWYETLYVNVCQLSSLKSSEDGHLPIPSQTYHPVGRAIKYVLRD